MEISTTISAVNGRHLARCTKLPHWPYARHLSIFKCFHVKICVSAFLNLSAAIVLAYSNLTHTRDTGQDPNSLSDSKFSDWSEIMAGKVGIVRCVTHVVHQLPSRPIIKIFLMHFI